ncbi:unnamed protein product, partial [Pocillopora meandrina]
MSRTTNFMILSFSILQTGDRVMSFKGNRTLCIVNGPEKYDTLKTSLGNVISDINCIIKNSKIEVDVKEVKIEMFLGGDYKFLLMTVGLKGATSDYACVITDRLTENIITEGEDKGIYLKRLISVINDLGITFLVWEKTNADGKGSGSYDWTSLMGSDKKKLLHQESRDILWPETKETVVKLWRVTPYMHALSYHVPVFIKNHKTFKQFPGQGAEKNNDDAKRIFFQKPNKWN